jgi:hypothetical protein
MFPSLSCHLCGYRWKVEAEECPPSKTLHCPVLTIVDMLCSRLSPRPNAPTPGGMLGMYSASRQSPCYKQRPCFSCALVWGSDLYPTHVLALQCERMMFMESHARLNGVTKQTLSIRGKQTLHFPGNVPIRNAVLSTQISYGGCCSPVDTVDHCYFCKVASLPRTHHHPVNTSKF